MKKYIIDVLIGVSIAIIITVIFGPLSPGLIAILGFTCTITVKAIRDELKKIF